MWRFLKFLIIIITLANCQSKKSSDPIVSIDWNDKEMNDSISKARESLGQFIVALADTSSKFSRFSIKQSFEIFDGDEHIWLSHVKLVNNQLVGVIDNIPGSINNIELGDTIVIDKTRVSDWIYIVDSTLVGGFTTKLLRKRMTVKERKKFDEETGYIFE